MAYITITEFAERAGVTPQAVYKRVKQDLEPFLKVENGVKLLSEEALNLVNVKQPGKQSATAKEQEELINQLKEENLSLTKRLNENNEKLLELLEKQAQQLENYQILVAQAQQVQQELIKLKSTETTPKLVEESSASTPTTSRKPKFLSWFTKRN